MPFRRHVFLNSRGRWARILSNLVPKTFHLACLLRQFGTLGTIERCRGAWEHTEGDLGGPGLDFYRFWKDFGTAIWTFLANVGTTIVFFGMRVCRSRFLKILGSESGCLGLQNQAFGVEGIARTSFSHMSGLYRFWCNFYEIFDGFGTKLDDFWWPGATLETS